MKKALFAILLLTSGASIANATDTSTYLGKGFSTLITSSLAVQLPAPSSEIERIAIKTGACQPSSIDMSPTAASNFYKLEMRLDCPENEGRRLTFHLQGTAELLPASLRKGESANLAFINEPDIYLRTTMTGRYGTGRQDVVFNLKIDAQ